MIDRYSLPEMTEIWSPESRFHYLLRVEKTVAEVQGEMGLIPKKAARAIVTKSRFDVKRIAYLEKTLKHDVIAFVKNVASYVGPLGKYLHFGMTSSDVLDTASSLQLLDAIGKIEVVLNSVNSTILKLAKENKNSLCAGRTHGMHAEPTTFGYKLLGHLAEFLRAKESLLFAKKGVSVGKLSGAVGTYSTQSPAVEARVCKKLKLSTEAVATQVIPRDRHLEVLHALARLGCAIERLAIELRHLQRTEIAEVTEGFSQGQRGSSAMPHKKNPISAENLTGAARLLRSYVQAAYENVALWHERDISHSSVERVIWPDSFVLCHYALNRLESLLSGLQIDPSRMLKNLAQSSGQIFSSQLLLRLVEKGLSREEAYLLVQKLSHQVSSKDDLYTQAAADLVVQKWLERRDLDQIFSGELHKAAIAAAFARAIKGLRL